MSVIGNPLLLGGDAGAPSFTTERSVRLRSSASAYFNRTQTTTTNSVKCTFSCWIKRGALGTTQNILSGFTGSDADTRIFFDTDNTLRFYSRITNTNGAPAEWYGLSSALFRDPSAWYHIVVSVDTSIAQATNNAYYVVYVNGIAQTFTTVGGASLVSAATVQNRNTCWNVSAYTSQIGAQRTANFTDGYLTEINFIDGQALTPSSFCEYDSVRNTQWKPKAYTGTYGTNGFYLKFANPASIGLDSSPNGNNWTATGIQTSNSALTTYDSMLDVPTLTSETASNFATLNPIAGQGNGTYSDGNLAYLNGVNATWKSGVASMGVSSGKYYFEYTVTTVSSSSNFYLGVAGSTYNGFASYLGKTSDSWAFQWNGASSVKTNNDTSTTVSTAGSISVNDVIQVAIDLGTGSIWWGRNNTWVQGDPSAGTGASFTNLTGTILPAFAVYSNGGDKIAANFGQRPFAGTVPTGFKRLNTYNLPEPAVASSDDYHKVYTYTGNGGGLQVGEIQKPMSLFNLDRSIRIRAAVNAYFSRLPTVNGNGQKFTISTWIKRGKLGTGWTDTIFTGRTGTNFPELDIIFSTDLIKLQAYTTGAALLMNVDTVNLYRDTNMWYHVVTAFDTTQAVAADRVKVYVNGVAQTIAAGATYPSQNLVLNANQTVTQYIGSSPANTAWGDLYFADYYMIDGQALAPTSFGAFDGNNYWTPKAYTGTYGTNGFHLEFEDFSNNTATTIGKDTSGQGNNWTPTGINVTIPANTNVSWDSMVDVPTSTSTDVANFCTLNPIQVSFNTSGTIGTITNGNLTATAAAGASDAFHPAGTLAAVGDKYYAEVTVVAAGTSGALSTYVAINEVNNGAGVYAAYSKDGQKYDTASGWVTGYATYTAGDVIGIGLDYSNRTTLTYTFYKNGTSIVSGTISLSGNPTFACRVQAGASMSFNFGQRPFRYTPPTGFKSLNSFNVAEVTGDLESPDFVWIKSRSASGDHALFNSVTGVGKYLRTSNAVLEVNDVNSLIQFNKNGFLLGNAAIANASATTFVASAWKVAATTVTNTNGSVTSQVRANPTSGISIATFTAAASGNFTVGHGLGVAPSMVILKNRGATDSFYVYNRNFATPTTHYLQMNSTSVILSSASIWGSTNPTSSVVTLGAGGGIAANASGIIYCFSDVAGFSKFGSYISNNASDGPFVYTGFRPRWLMVKRAMTTAGAAGWFMYDVERNTYNTMDKYLFAEGTAGENTLAVFDFTSNGFKIRSNNVHVNTTAGDTYIYMAFAEHPFKYALAR